MQWKKKDESRELWVISNEEVKFIRALTRFPGLRQIACVKHSWTVGDEVRTEIRYFVTSIARNRLSPQRLLGLIRSHWQVENSLHHVLDHSWREDHLRYSPPLGKVLAQFRALSINALRRLSRKSKASTLPQKALELLAQPLKTVRSLGKL